MPQRARLVVGPGGSWTSQSFSALRPRPPRHRHSHGRCVSPAEWNGLNRRLSAQRRLPPGTHQRLFTIRRKREVDQAEDRRSTVVASGKLQATSQPHSPLRRMGKLPARRVGWKVPLGGVRRVTACSTRQASWRCLPHPPLPYHPTCGRYRFFCRASPAVSGDKQFYRYAPDMIELRGRGAGSVRGRLARRARGDTDVASSSIRGRLSQPSFPGPANPLPIRPARAPLK